MSNNSDVTSKDFKTFFPKVKSFFTSAIFKKILVCLIIITLIIMAVSIIILNNKISYFKSSLKLHELIYHNEGNVDLSITSFQPIDSKFVVGKFNVTKHLNGIKVNGIILNTKSVGYIDSEFEIYVNSQAQKFQVRNIPSGYASKFSVYIPNVPLNNSRWGTIKYIKGQIKYRMYN